VPAQQHFVDVVDEDVLLPEYVLQLVFHRLVESLTLVVQSSRFKQETDYWKCTEVFFWRNRETF
jgi:hypothetical protein